jgi:hypothetical protein
MLETPVSKAPEWELVPFKWVSLDQNLADYQRGKLDGQE